MITNLSRMRAMTREICPEQLPILDRIDVLVFMENLQTEFNKLGLQKKFTSKELHCGIDFCYRRPIVLWTRTGYSFPKRMEDELFADCYIVDDKVGFEAAAPVSADDIGGMTEEELAHLELTSGMIEKSWPLAMLTSDPERLTREIIAEFKAFYRPFKSVQNW